MELQSEKSTWVAKMSQFCFERSGGGKAERRVVIRVWAKGGGGGRWWRV